MDPDGWGEATVLVVNDEPSCREAFRAALEDEYDLVETESGEEALDILSVRKDIDLILLDYLLPPGIDGLQVLKRMKEMYCTVHVIIVTGHGTQMICRDAFKSGAEDYITKPFKVDNLRKIISDVLAVPEVRKPPVDQAIAFMEEHYGQPISASDVAEAIQISYDHLAYLFKAEKGNSIQRWLNRLRIDKAKVLLRCSELAIKELTWQTGFKDQNYFCRLFRKNTDISPQQYRKQSKQD